MELLFEWDEAKARSNHVKHGVTFAEARTVFNDPFSLTIGDPDRSVAEDRWVDIGLSAAGRVLVVWYTERDDVIRIIGCRKATLAEQRQYAHE